MEEYKQRLKRQKNRSRSWYTSADEGVIIMYLIVGLGNPGKQYENTRHNVGFDAVDLLVDEYRVPLRENNIRQCTERA